MDKLNAMHETFHFVKSYTEFSNRFNCNEKNKILLILYFYMVPVKYTKIFKTHI